MQSTKKLSKKTTHQNPTFPSLMRGCLVLFCVKGVLVKTDKTRDLRTTKFPILKSVGVEKWTPLHTRQSNGGKESKSSVLVLAVSASL